MKQLSIVGLLLCCAVFACTSPPIATPSQTVVAPSQTVAPTQQETIMPVVSPTVTPVPATPTFITPTPIETLEQPDVSHTWPGVYVENTPNHVTRRCSPGVVDPIEQCPIIKDGDRAFYITLYGVFPVTDVFMDINDVPWMCLDDDAQGHTCSVVTAYCYNGVRFGDLYFGTTVEDFIAGERPPIESCLFY